MKRLFRALLALLLLATCAAHADTYPSRTIRMIVPGAPGTSPDILARTLAQYLSARVASRY